MTTELVSGVLIGLCVFGWIVWFVTFDEKERQEHERAARSRGHETRPVPKSERTEV